MAAQHCRIKMYSMDRYLLPGNNKRPIFSKTGYKHKRRKEILEIN